LFFFPAFWSVSPSARLKGVFPKHRGGAAWPPAAAMDASVAALRAALEAAQVPPPAPPAPPAPPVPSSQAGAGPTGKRACQQLSMLSTNSLFPKPAYIRRLIT